jgi:hypothetical protein
VQRQAARTFGRDTEPPAASSARWEDRRRKPADQMRLVLAPRPTSIPGPQAGRADALPRLGVPPVLTSQVIKFTTAARFGFRNRSTRRRSRRTGESRMLLRSIAETGLRCCVRSTGVNSRGDASSLFAAYQLVKAAQLPCCGRDSVWFVRRLCTQPRIRTASISRIASPALRWTQ